MYEVSQASRFRRLVPSLVLGFALCATALAGAPRALAYDFPPADCATSQPGVVMDEYPSVPVTICGTEYTDVVALHYGGSASSKSFLFFNPGDVTILSTGTYTTGGLTGEKWARFSVTHGAYFYGCDSSWSNCYMYNGYVPDRGSATYATSSGSGIYHSSWDFDGFFTPDITTAPEFDLSVVSPALDGSNSADVQPDTRFYMKLNYSVSSWDYSDVRFWWYQCPDYDHCDSATLTDDDLVGTDLLSSVRSELGSAENGNVYVSVPVQEGAHTLLYFKLTTESDHTNRTLATADLFGVDDTALPSGGDALSGSYTDIPNILTNPSGFVEALLDNAGAFVVNAIIPPPGYLTDKMLDVTDSWSADQPGLTSINTAFIDGIASLSSPTSLTPISIGALHVGGTTTSSITFFDPSIMPTGIFDTAKTLISAFMYFGVAFWVIREMSTILSA